MKELGHIPTPKAAPALEISVSCRVISSQSLCPVTLSVQGHSWSLFGWLNCPSRSQVRRGRNNRAAKTFGEGAPSVPWESPEAELCHRGGGGRWE